MQAVSRTTKSVRSECLSPSEFRLWDSIRHVGTLQPLIFVKSRESHCITLFGGGQTRLKLLDAVQRERQHNGQKAVPCRVVVRHDSVPNKEINLSHLIQNQIRHHRTFIDKALHLNDCVETREGEIARSMSQRETIKWLRENGFPISQSLLSDMLFTARELDPLLSKALANGMGRRNVVNIRKLYHAMHDIWKSFGDDLADCQEAFQDICEECDSETFDIELFREVMEREICLWCGINSQYVRALLLVDQEERKRLIVAISNAGRKDKQVPHNCQAPTRTMNKTNQVRHSVSTCPPLNFELPPAVVNRRKRYARGIALELARRANFLDCLSGSMSHHVGYRVLQTPNSSTARVKAIWQFLHYCQQAIESDSRANQYVVPSWHLLDRKEFSQICSLIEVIRSMYLAKQVVRYDPQLANAA